MIVTLTGAFQNAGDHLIVERSHKLLSKYTDKEIININRAKIRDEHYKLFNSARALILCGGPAYQRNIYPGIYPIDIERIRVPVVPFGLGWKAKLDSDPAGYMFSNLSENFIQSIHRVIEYSSVRDEMTEKVIKSRVKNVLMTGCPAWYDLDTIGQKFISSGSINTIAYSLPAKMTWNSFETLSILSNRFPNANKYIALHHGYFPTLNPMKIHRGLNNIGISILSSLRQYKPVSLKGNLNKLKSLYSNVDLHIGYRVHAHLYCLSRNIPSILISEDNRGIAQNITLNNRYIKGNLNNRTFKEEIENALDDVIGGNKDELNKAVDKINKTYPVMQQFLQSINKI